MTTCPTGSRPRSTSMLVPLPQRRKSAHENGKTALSKSHDPAADHQTRNGTPRAVAATCAHPRASHRSSWASGCLRRSRPRLGRRRCARRARPRRAIAFVAKDWPAGVRQTRQMSPKHKPRTAVGRYESSRERAAQVGESRGGDSRPRRGHVQRHERQLANSRARCPLKSSPCAGDKRD